MQVQTVLLREILELPVQKGQARKHTSFVAPSQLEIHQSGLRRPRNGTQLQSQRLRKEHFKKYGKNVFSIECPISGIESKVKPHPKALRKRARNYRKTYKPFAQIGDSSKNLYKRN